MANQIMPFFEFNHLPEGEMRDTSERFHTLAHDLDSTLPDGAEKATALRKVLEGKDAAVRAVMPQPETQEAGAQQQQQQQGQPAPDAS